MAQVYPNVEKRGVPITSLDQLQGDWKCVMADRHIMQEGVTSDVHLNNVRIKGDSTWYFEYPCKFYRLEVSNMDSVFKTNPTLDHLKFLHDTLVIWSDESEMEGYRFYVRDTFDQKIVNTLLRDTVYLPSLFGKWYLQTQDCMDYSGNPPWRVTYPVYMPPVYKLDKADVVNKNTILLNINGTLRKFKVVRCSIDEGYIELKQDGWYKNLFRIVTYYDWYRTHDECGNDIIYR